MPPAAAAVGAAVIGAGGSIYAGNKAAKAQGAAADQAAAVQQNIYNQTREDQGPYRQAGYDALEELRGLLGLPSGASSADRAEGTEARNRLQDILNAKDLNYRKGQNFSAITGIDDIDSGDFSGISDEQLAQLTARGNNLSFKRDGEAISLIRQLRSMGSGGGSNALATPRLDQEAYFDRFRSTPGYQFMLDEGEKAVGRGMAARGLNRSGRTLLELQRHGSGLADQTYGQHYNRLTGIAGVGQTATNAVGAAGQNYATGMGNAAMARGDARASGYINTANAVGNALNQGAQAYGYFNQPQASGGFGDGFSTRYG